MWLVQELWLKILDYLEKLRYPPNTIHLEGLNMSFALTRLAAKVVVAAILTFTVAFAASANQAAAQGNNDPFAIAAKHNSNTQNTDTTTQQNNPSNDTMDNSSDPEQPSTTPDQSQSDGSDMNNTGGMPTTTPQTSTTPSQLPSETPSPKSPDQTQANQTQSNAIPDTTIVDFAQKAAVATFTYNYQTYQQDITAMQNYFTKAGWDSFNKALSASNNLNVVQKEKLTVSAQVAGTAEIKQHQQTATGQNWQVQIPVTVTYKNDKNQQVQQNLDVKLSITTVSTDENSNGFGIEQFVAVPNMKPASAINQ